MWYREMLHESVSIYYPSLANFCERLTLNILVLLVYDKMLCWISSVPCLDPMSFPMLYFSMSLTSTTNVPELTMILWDFLLFETLYWTSRYLLISVPLIRWNRVYTVFSLRFWDTFRDGGPSLLFSRFLSRTHFMMALHAQRHSFGPSYCRIAFWCRKNVFF